MLPYLFKLGYKDFFIRPDQSHFRSKIQNAQHAVTAPYFNRIEFYKYYIFHGNLFHELLLKATNPPNFTVQTVTLNR